MKINKSLFDSLCSRAGFGDPVTSLTAQATNLYNVAVWYVHERAGVIFQEIAKATHSEHMERLFVGVKRFKGFKHE